MFLLENSLGIEALIVSAVSAVVSGWYPSSEASLVGENSFLRNTLFSIVLWLNLKGIPAFSGVTFLITANDLEGEGVLAERLMVVLLKFIIGRWSLIFWLRR